MQTDTGTFMKKLITFLIEKLKQNEIKEDNMVEETTTKGDVLNPLPWRIPTNSTNNRRKECRKGEVTRTKKTLTTFYVRKKLDIPQF